MCNESQYWVAGLEVEEWAGDFEVVPVKAAEHGCGGEAGYFD